MLTSSESCVANQNVSSNKINITANDILPITLRTFLASINNKTTLLN